MTYEISEETLQQVKRYVRRRRRLAMAEGLLYGMSLGVLLTALIFSL